MIQPTSAPTILAALQEYGPAPGAKAMMDREILHAKEALTSGLYITFSNLTKKSECFRVGSQSLCFCGHKFSEHAKPAKSKGPIKYACGSCSCKNFSFMFQRPEEQGLWWLPRRKGFDLSKWKATCTCKHNHEFHDPNTYKCQAKCGCYRFSSDSPCLVCDAKWEDHDIIYETREERLLQKKPVDDAFLPLSNTPAIQNAYAKKTGKIPVNIEEEDKIPPDSKMRRLENGMLELNITPEMGKGNIGVFMQLPKHSDKIRPVQKPGQKEKSIKLMEKSSGEHGGYISKGKSSLPLPVKKEIKKAIKK